jgi:hypothetical protein
MSVARDLVYNFVNKTARTARQEIAHHPKDHNGYQAVEGGSEDDDYLHGLLSWVEDDRAHREAEKLREEAHHVKTAESAFEDSSIVPQTIHVLEIAADIIDPYEIRDGQLVRKSDGKVMDCEKCL